MPSGWSAAQITELTANKCTPIHLVEFDYSLSGATTTNYLTDAHREVVYDGNTYLAAGGLLGFTDIETSADLAINTLTLSISGVDQTYVSIFLTYYWLWHPVRIYKWFLDSDDAVIGAPIQIFRGYMDGPTITDSGPGGTSTISIPCASFWADFDRRAGRHTNLSEQQYYFPDDTGFEYLSQLVDANIIWGIQPLRKGTGTPSHWPGGP